MSDRESDAFDAAVAVVTCILGGDPAEARRIVLSNDILHADMIRVLAGALAAGHTLESWRQSILTAHREG